jgi:hypothetical protein
MMTILIIILLLLAIGGAPSWGYHQVGWGPSGIVGLIVLILMIMLLLGHL